MTDPTRPVERPGPMPPLSLRGWLRYDVIKRAVRVLQPETTLEIGCGQGAVGARLATLTTYVGVEPDVESFLVAQDRITPRSGTVLNGMHTVVPAGSTHDLVCAFEVLEHIEDDVTALAEWTAFIRPGGHLMLSVPAFQEKFGAWDTFAGHFRRYSPDDLTKRLLRAGLVDVDITVYGWPIGYPTESLRNWVAARKYVGKGDVSAEEMTTASGRRFQPNTMVMGSVLAAAAAPFRLLQRVQPTRGTGVVAVARKPS
jgi:SAM-dependent methyltransferase